MPINQALARAATAAPVVFRDGFGERRRFVSADPDKAALEVLLLDPELTSVPSFEFALRERVARVAAFRHAYFRRVRAVERCNDARSTLALVSDATPGVRLSEMLEEAERRQVRLEINAAMCLLRQLVSAVAIFHESVRDTEHGAIAPERIVVTPHARLVVVEHVFGGALEQLAFSSVRYWKDLRVALPPSAGPLRFDRRADVAQVGVVALSLILARVLRDDEYPAGIESALSSASAISSRSDFKPLTARLRAWLARALQIDVRHAFASAVDARADLEDVLDEGEYLAAPAALEAFLAKYHEPASCSPASTSGSHVERSHPVDDPPTRVAPLVEIPLVGPKAPSCADGPTVPPSGSAPFSSLPQPEAAPPMTVRLADTPRLSEREPHEDASAGFGSIHRMSPTEPEEERSEMTVPTPSRRFHRPLAAAAAVFVLIGGGAFVAKQSVFSSARVPSTGRIAIDTNTPGIQVVVDGEVRGVTPIGLALEAGPHVMELRSAGSQRAIPLTIVAGAEIVQYIEMAKADPTTGQLDVRTEPAGAQVTIDGVQRGTSPVTISELPVGDHAVVLQAEAGSAHQTVKIEAGATASLVVQLTAAPPSVPLPGWISVSAPADVEVYENDRLLGSSKTDQLMVTAGRHELEIAAAAFGFRTMRTVQVVPGKVSSIKIEFPKGTLALNAIPWADVWVDGENVGQTPIGNLAIAIGSHNVVFRHPELGEQHAVVVVGLTAPSRLSADMRKR
jgi:hypothetical protein